MIQYPMRACSPKQPRMPVETSRTESRAIVLVKSIGQHLSGRSVESIREAIKGACNNVKQSHRSIPKPFSPRRMEGERSPNTA